MDHRNAILGNVFLSELPVWLTGKTAVEPDKRYLVSNPSGFVRQELYIERMEQAFHTYLLPILPTLAVTSSKAVEESPEATARGRRRWRQILSRAGESGFGG